MKKILLMLVVLLVFAAAGFLLIQFIPFGTGHNNPPVTGQPNWDSPETLALSQRACFDCHSNETVWPWYSNVAPVSWLVQKDVDEGREELNFSTWGTGEQEADEIVESVREGEMPPSIYLITHPEARLTAEEEQRLVLGLTNTFGAGEEEEGDED